MKFQLLKQAVIGPNVPMAVFDNLYTAKENDLKVILYALAKGEADPLDISAHLQISVAGVQSSLLFWADKGLIARHEEDGIAARKKQLSSQEILKLSNKHPEINILISRLQQIYGHAINERATNAFVSLYVQDNIPIEVILILTVYYAPVQKGPAYTAKVILNLFKKNSITSAQKAEEHIRLMEKREQFYKTVCDIFSYDIQKLTSSEKTIIDSWAERLKMPEEMIKAAFEAAGANAEIRYCNGILKSWAQKGYKTPLDTQQEFSGLSGGTQIDIKDDPIFKHMSFVPSFEEENPNEH